MYNVLPWKRKLNHFNEGDRVMVFFQEKNVWLPGTIVKGYKYQQGLVSFYLDTDNIPKYDYLDKIDDSEEEKELIEEVGKIYHSRGVGNNSPVILLYGEYVYFVNNTYEWNKWKSLINLKLFNGKFININKQPTI